MLLQVIMSFFIADPLVTEPTNVTYKDEPLSPGSDTLISNHVSNSVMGEVKPHPEKPFPPRDSPKLELIESTPFLYRCVLKTFSLFSFNIPSPFISSQRCHFGCLLIFRFSPEIFLSDTSDTLYYNSMGGAHTRFHEYFRWKNTNRGSLYGAVIVFDLGSPEGWDELLEFIDMDLRKGPILNSCYVFAVVGLKADKGDTISREKIDALRRKCAPPPLVCTSHRVLCFMFLYNIRLHDVPYFECSVVQGNAYDSFLSLLSVYFEVLKRFERRV